MSSSKTQPEVNREEWENFDNWAGFWIWKVYFGKRDSRIWVPLWWDNPLSPHTINLGHRFGFLVMSLIFYSGLAMIAWIGWSEFHRK